MKKIIKICFLFDTGLGLTKLKWTVGPLWRHVLYWVPFLFHLILLATGQNGYDTQGMCPIQEKCQLTVAQAKHWVGAD